MMLNVMNVLLQRDIPKSSVSAAVQRVRDMIEHAPNACTASQKYIKELTDVDVSFEDDTIARLVAQYITVDVVRHNGFLEDPAALVTQAQEKAVSFREDKTHAWIYATIEKVIQEGNIHQAVEGIDAKVEMTAEGKIKKGGKQVIAAEMYKKHVLSSTPSLTNQEFVQLLMKELQMTKSGATTYAYMVKKQLGEPEGGIVKSKKGRKAKEVAA